MTQDEVSLEAVRIAAELQARGLPVIGAREMDHGAKAGFAIRLPNGRVWGFRVPVENLKTERVAELVESYL